MGLRPVADGREGQARGDGRRQAGRLPEVTNHRLARRLELEALADRQQAVAIAIVLAEGEECTVRREEVDGFPAVVVQLDLDLDRVGFQKDEPVGGVVLGERLGGTVQVDDEGG